MAARMITDRRALSRCQPRMRPSEGGIKIRNRSFNRRIQRKPIETLKKWGKFLVVMGCRDWLDRTPRPDESAIETCPVWNHNGCGGGTELSLVLVRNYESATAVGRRRLGGRGWKRFRSRIGELNTINIKK
ncbi:hypothetical protein B296_00039605 [Ensete ventricosum]|uniref:Uncharacterized protein n=1 Tax=Ensete ventricosum TaxID=4639 RepID=A0A426YHD6_ENSVE|nr:hypothetical protein B296_00039605 [Ensete ventricosum]